MSENVKESHENYLNFPTVLPEEHYGYYDAMQAQHFNPEGGVGSQFTAPDVKSLPDLLTIAQNQRGSLEGDDRQKFIEEGASEKGMLPFCRYLKVETQGSVGIAKAKELPRDTKVKVMRTKPGAPCSLVVEIDSKENLPKTNFATVIIGPNEADERNPNPSTKEMVWTTHPGAPIRPIASDNFAEGSVITIDELMANQKFIDEVGGKENVYLSIQVVSK
ncbi:MAG: hypothetical protein WC806_05535 [Candidatus Gracilibacteria bacterium]|jgi:hypothetical protein